MWKKTLYYFFVAQLGLTWWHDLNYSLLNTYQMNNEEKNELVLKEVLIKKQEIIIKILKKRLCIFPKFLTQKITSTHLKNSQKKKLKERQLFQKIISKRHQIFLPHFLQIHFKLIFFKDPSLFPSQISQTK